MNTNISSLKKIDVKCNEENYVLKDVIKIEKNKTLLESYIKSWNCKIKNLDYTKDQKNDLLNWIKDQFNYYQNLEIPKQFLVDVYSTDGYQLLNGVLYKNYLDLNDRDLVYEISEDLYQFHDNEGEEIQISIGNPERIKSEFKKYIKINFNDPVVLKDMNVLNQMTYLFWYFFNKDKISFEKFYLQLFSKIDDRKNITKIIQYSKQLGNILNEIIINAPKVPTDIIVFRGTRDKYFMKENIYKNNLIKLDTFVSTSLNIVSALKFINKKEGCLNIISLKKGDKGLMMFIMGETEILLPKNLELTLVTNKTQKIIQPVKYKPDETITYEIEVFYWDINKNDINTFCSNPTKESFYLLDKEVQKEFIKYSKICIKKNKGNLSLAKLVLSYSS